MNILALDLATRTGWATRQYGSLQSGVQDFSLRRGESPGMRYLRLHRWLIDTRDYIDPIGLIVYEEAHHRGGAPTQVANGLIAHVQAFCAQFEIEHISVHTATLKKFATGKGNAGKPEMIAAMRKRWNRPELENPDEADALALLAWAEEQFAPKETK